MNTIESGKTFFKVYVNLEMLHFLHVRLTKNIYLVENHWLRGLLLLVPGIYILSLWSFWTTCNTTWCCWGSSTKQWWRPWLLLQDWTKTKLLFAWSCDSSTLLPYVKLFPPSIFNSVDFWNSMSFFFLDIELGERKVIRELRILFHGNVQE